MIGASTNYAVTVNGKVVFKGSKVQALALAKVARKTTTSTVRLWNAPGAELGKLLK